MLQVNFNKLNTNFSDENAQAKTIGNNLKQQPLLKQQQQLKVKPGDENYVQPITSKDTGSGDNLGKGALLDLKEPSPPKLKSHSRNNVPRRALASSKTDQQQQQQPQYRLLEPQLLQPQPQPQQQEPKISRIPRLSLRPLAAINSNVPSQRTTRAVEHQPPQIEDIDKSTSRDAIFFVSDIAKDIYQYMFDLEEQQAIRFDHLKNQKIFTPKIRQRLINWCVEIHDKLKLLPETLYMTIAVIDRFFDRVTAVQQNQVQLAAVCATLIASKYEEIYPPEIGDLQHLTQNTYTRREIMRTEIQILEQLDFNLGKPIPLAFLRRFSKAAHCDTKMHSMAKYLMELSLTEYECSHWKPSLLAAAALFATIHLVHHDPSGLRRASPLANLKLDNQQQQSQQPDRWTKTLVHYTHYIREDLQKPAARLCKILKQTQKSPLSNYCAKKNLANIGNWPEFNSSRVDEVIKMGEKS